MRKASGSIQHVVIIVKENRTFDNYFGRFPGVDGDGNLAAASDPPSTDHPHEHAAWLKRASGAAKEQYGQANIPNYWRYARQYTLCDRYFTEVAGAATAPTPMPYPPAPPPLAHPHTRPPHTDTPPSATPPRPSAHAQASATHREVT